MTGLFPSCVEYRTPGWWQGLLQPLLKACIALGGDGTRINTDKYNCEEFFEGKK